MLGTNYSLLRDEVINAIENNDIEKLNDIEKKITSEILLEMIEGRNWELAFIAIQKGHLEVIAWFKNKASEKLDQMITADNYSAFWRAAEQGHLHILQ